MAAVVDLNARMSFFQRDSDKRFVTWIWLDYENKTSENKMKKNENTYRICMLKET